MPTMSAGTRGLSIADGCRRFPNARYLIARQEWEHWERTELRARYTTDPYYEDSLLPVMESGRAQLVASDYAFNDSVWIEAWPGHAPGHVCVIA